MVSRRGPTWQPKGEDYRQVFSEQNPWHGAASVPDELAKRVERPLAQQLWRRLRSNTPARFQLVLGPRRVGKSTALYQSVRHLLTAGIEHNRVWWLRLDHPLLMRVPLDVLVRSVIDSSRATPERPAYVFLDELAYADQWDLWLKTFYDEKWPIQIAGSSSSTAVLRERRVESGVGRWDEQYLAPYLFGEYLALVGDPAKLDIGDSLQVTLQSVLQESRGMPDVSSLRRRFLLTGGFPELLISGSLRNKDDDTALLQSQRTLRADAVERAIYKDIPQAFTMGDPLLLERLLYTLAGQLTGILSPQSICQNLGSMTQPTFDKYLSYLERSFLVFTLPNYSGSEAGVQRRGRKLYFVDGAVRNAALQRGLAPLSDPCEMGLLIENLVAGHLHALGQQTGVRLYHWRDKDDEVDLIYDHPEYPFAFEVGLSASHSRNGLYRFVDRFPRFKGRCFLVAPNALPCSPESAWDKVGTIPLDALLLAVSAQAERELSRRLAP